MIETLPAQLGSVLSVAILLFTFLKGDEPERVGGGAFALGWFATVLVQDDTRLHAPQWEMMVIDMIMLLVFVALCWKARRAWPAWAAGFQALVVMCHVLSFVDLRPSMHAFYTIINLAAYGILGALGLGVLRAWRDRRAIGLT